ncbi:MAG: phytanoyl-CoA dioxygenase family protein [Lentisphaerae bacterium]|nr:phytanoyl-CoA dioxygenase family protein [Lentisphaerota bacterium]
MTGLSTSQWEAFEARGILRLGKVASDRQMDALRQRIDDIMLGRAAVNYDRMLMQLDSDSGKYEDAGPQTPGHKGATLNYRKIQDLEFDPLFLAYMQHPIFEDTCHRLYGPQTPIACYRAMFMNKPAGRGTFLPWHQDRWNVLDRDPLLTVYTALDSATAENGCVQLIPGSHQMGLINPDHGSGFLTTEQASARCTPDKVELLELQVGEVALLHNWVLHASDVNRSQHSRRAFSVCYMDARTMDMRAKALASQSVIFGAGALRPADQRVEQA